MVKPLEGIKVVEWTAFQVGPRCGAHLADWGADVIKLEQPGGGYRTGARAGSIDWSFQMQNRGKRSLTLDLRQEKGQRIAHQLIKAADIYLSNFQPQAQQRFHLDYETLANLNPRLIYAQVTGWGMRGPDKDRPGFDFAVWARSGLMDALGEPDTPPVSCRAGLGDNITAMTLFGAISLALYNRGRTGQGQMVDASILGCLVDQGASNLMTNLSTGVPVTRASRREARSPLTNFYQTQDGRWLQFAMMSHSDHYWSHFCQVLGIQECEHDPRFLNQDLRAQHYKELIPIVEKAIASRPKQEWIERLEGTDMPWSFVTTFDELTRDPQLWANDYIIEVEDPAVGKMRMPGPSIHMSRTGAEVRRGAPELGQSTEEILLELGYSRSDIDALKGGGVIG